MTYLITYDLQKPGQNYDALINSLNASGAVRIQLSTWVIRSDLNSGAVRDHFRQYLDANDRIFVGEMTINWASWNMLNVEAAKRVLP